MVRVSCLNGDCLDAVTPSQLGLHRGQRHQHIAVTRETAELLQRTDHPEP